MDGGAGSALGDGSAVSVSGNSLLNPYSCLLCRRKKKKCDRTHPCLNCRKLGAECVFHPRRPSTRQKVPLDPLERLHHLEDVICRLRAGLEDKLSRPPAEDGGIEARSAQEKRSTNHEQDCGDGATELETEVGRLAIGDGRSRYIVSSFWASLDDEVEDLKSLLKEQPDDAKELDTPEIPDFGMANQAYIFGFGSAQNDLLGLHPAVDKTLLYWHLYKENCDRIIKVLHLPTVEPLILQAATKLDRISKGLEALLFAMYFSVTASLSAAECLPLLSSEKDVLIHTYKYSMEQALARAHFLETEEVMVLQAFVVFLVGLRSHCSIRLMWSLTALAVRLAQNAGIHRDGTHFNLSPFVTEMRRRLWWSIGILDSRASEDSGYDAAIPKEGIDTKLPLNVNDSDLVPNMTEFPKPRVGSTDMTFSLVRFEANRTFRLLQYASAGTIGKCGKFHAAKSFATKSEWISKCQERIEELCLKHCSLSDPFSWYVAAISRILSTKMWLVAHHPYLRRDSCVGLPQDTKDRLFMMSIEGVEYWLLLNTETRTRKWRWLCETYIQWYALTFLLSELCIRTQGEVVDRAWNAVNGALKLGLRLSSASQAKDAECGQHQNLDETHKPLSKLLRKARSARADALSSSSGATASQTSEAELTLNTSIAKSAFVVDLPNIGFSDLAFEDPISVLGMPPFPHQPIQICQALSFDYDIHNPPYPLVDPQMSTWTQWLGPPEEYGFG